MRLVKEIKLLPSYFVTSDGEIWSTAKYRDRAIRLQASINNAGYKKVSIRGKNRYVHRLIAETFVPNLYGHPQVNHKDGNKLNNISDNLEWCSCSYNVRHAFDIGSATPRGSKGEESGASRLTNAQVIEIRRQIKQGASVRSLGRQYLISHSNISAIKNGKTWCHLLGDMNE
jgi:hypothetical protein